MIITARIQLGTDAVSLLEYLRSQVTSPEQRYGTLKDKCRYVSMCFSHHYSRSGLTSADNATHSA